MYVLYRFKYNTYLSHISMNITPLYLQICIYLYTCIWQHNSYTPLYVYLYMACKYSIMPNAYFVLCSLHCDIPNIVFDLLKHMG